MNRRGFLGRLASVIAIASMSPKLLATPVKEPEWLELTEDLPFYKDLDRFFLPFTEKDFIDGLREITGGWFEFNAHPDLEFAYLIKVPARCQSVVNEWLNFVRPVGVFMDVRVFDYE